MYFQGDKRAGPAGKSVSIMRKPVARKRKLHMKNEEIHSDSDDGTQ